MQHHLEEAQDPLPGYLFVSIVRYLIDLRLLLKSGTHHEAVVK